MFEAIDYNTQVIEVLAKNLLNFNNTLEQKYSIADLLEDLQNKGILKVQQKEKVSTYEKVKQKYISAKPAEIFKAMFILNNLNRKEEALLKLFAMLPSVNIAYQHLKDLLSKHNNLDEDLLALSQKGWLKYFEAEQAFKCNHVIQEVCLQALKTNSVLLDDFVDTIYDKLYYLSDISYSKSENLPLTSYITYAEELIDKGIKNQVYVSPNLCHLIADYQLSYNSLVLAEKYCNIYNYQYKALYDQDKRNVSFKNGLAISYSKLGEINTAQGNLEEALNYYNACIRLEKELYEQDKSNVRFKNSLAISYSKLGEVNAEQGNLEYALRYYNEDLKLTKELYLQDKSNMRFKNCLAISYSKLGGINESQGNLEEALKHYKAYNRLEKELYEKDKSNTSFKNGLAISYSKLGDINEPQGNLEKALKHYKESNGLCKELYEQDKSNVNFKYGLAISYSKLGNINASQGNLEEALKHYKECNKLEKELYEQDKSNVRFKNGLAISYEKLGNINASQGNLEEALKYYNEYNRLTKALYDQDKSNVRLVTINWLLLLNNKMIQQPSTI